MRKRRIIMLLAGCVVVLVAFVVWPREREPEYHGKKLSEWLALYKRGYASPNAREAEEAIRAIDASGVPWALRQLDSEPPAWKERSRAAIRKAPFPFVANLMERFLDFGERHVNPADARIYFMIVGPEARRAIPDLTRMMGDPALTLRVRRGAIYALAAIGKDAIPILAKALTNQAQMDREVIALYMGYMKDDLGIESKTVVRVLMTSLKDENAEVAATSAEVLGHLGVEPDLAVPALIESLRDPRLQVRKAAITGLGCFRQKTREAIPDLTRIMEDRNSTVDLRRAAIDMLALSGKEAIAPLLSALTNQAQLNRGYVAWSLGQMQGIGTNDIDPDVLSAVTNTLHQILGHETKGRE